jgi:hypothetical protein
MNYAPEMIEFLKDNALKHDTRELANLFNKEFNTNKNAGQIGRALEARNLKYKKCLKKYIGSKAGMEHIYKKEGVNYVYIRLSDKDQKKHKGKNKNFILKHHYLWEKTHGSIPKGYLVIFLDNNRFNFELDNLECVSRNELVLLKMNGFHTNNKEVTKAGLAIIRHRLAILKTMTKGMSEKERKLALGRLNYLERRRKEIAI